MTGLHIGGKSCSDIAKIAAVDGDRLAVTSLMQQHVYLCGVQCYMLCISCYWDQSRVTSLEGVFERPLKPSLAPVHAVKPHHDLAYLHSQWPLLPQLLEAETLCTQVTPFFLEPAPIKTSNYFGAVSNKSDTAT